MVTSSRKLFLFLVRDGGKQQTLIQDSDRDLCPVQERNQVVVKPTGWAGPMESDQREK